MKKNINIINKLEILKSCDELFVFYGSVGIRNKIGNNHI